MSRLSSPNGGMEKTKSLIGPYRATRLWNDIIASFRGSMPTGRHRRYMRNYENCFVASDAVFWLHRYLRDNPNFGSNVTRAQTVQLLQKILKARVFQDVRGGGHKEEFEDNNKLYRFSHSSPVKHHRTPLSSRVRSPIRSRVPVPTRTPLGPRTNMLFRDAGPQKPPRLNYDQMTPVTCVPEVGLSDVKLVGRQLSQAEIQAEYKMLTLTCLQKLLQLDDLDDVMDTQSVSSNRVFHNMTFLTKSGMVTNLPAQNQLPHWVLSAMKCLANWPNKTDENLPSYPGFEKDVFRVIQGYFQALDGPLLTYDMYDVFTNILILADDMEQELISRWSNSDSARSATSTLPSFASVENLMVNLTMSGQPGAAYEAQEQPRRELRGSGPSAWNVSGIESNVACDYPSHCNNSTGSIRYKTSATRSVMETEFSSTDNRIHQIVHPTSSVPGDGYHNTMYGSSATNSGSIENSRRFTSDLNVNSEDRGQSNMPKSQRFFSTTDLSGLRVCENGLKAQYQVAQCMDSRSTVTTTFGSVAEDDVFLDHCGSTQTLNRWRSKHTGQHARQADVEGNQNNMRNAESCMNLASWDSQGCLLRNEGSTRVPPKYPSPPYFNSHRPIINGASRQNTSISDNSNSYHTAHSNPSNLSGGSGSPYVTASSSRHDSGIGQPCSERTISRTAYRTNNPRMLQSMDSELRRHSSQASLFSEAAPSVVQDALQLCCLLLPPDKKRKLHLLLRLMSKMSDNDLLVLDPIVHIRSLVIQTFSRCIFCSLEEADLDELLAFRLVTFMMDNCDAILSVPTNLKNRIEDRVAHLRRAQVQAEPPLLIPVVTAQQYERQKLGHSQRALADLLDNIAQNPRLAQKEKRKKLKQFQKTYPDIYRMRFPTVESEDALFPKKQPKIKQPLLHNLAKPLQKLRSMRF